MRIGVIGAGHAGVEAAGQARRHGAEVVLFSGEPVPPYFRPRVVALAFGQVEPDGIHLKPEPWYREQGIELRLDAEATCVDASAKHVTAGGHEEKFDALVIATGGGQLTSAPEPVAPLLFQHADLELQSIGPSAGADLEERDSFDNGPTVYRSVLLENDLLRGVQMVGSRDGFGRLADALGRPWEAGELPYAH